MNVIVESFKHSLLTNIISLISYFRIITQANNFISGLNTNVQTFGSSYSGEVAILFYFRRYYLNVQLNEYVSCDIAQSTSLAAIYSTVISTWTNPSQNSTIINGFYVGCTPFEALLESTLDCLYEIECLHLLNNYFPSLNENLTKYVLLLTNKTNRTVHDHLSNLFVDEWTTKINYSTYFHSCNPSKCTYSTTSITNYSYAVALFISLYSGLIMILRTISLSCIEFIWKLKHQRVNQISIQIFLTSSKTYVQKLNLFKIVDQRTEDRIKQQKLTTRIYLILLAIAATTLLLFNSLNMETVTVTTSNPSLNTYIKLQELHSQTLRCPCSTITIPYNQFLLFSPILHQICSSDWIKNKWLTILTQSATASAENDWRNGAYQQFNLLSELCQLANQTIANAIDEFLLQSFVVSSMPSNINFHAQIDKILSEFYQSTTVYVQQLIDASNIFIQVDQPFMIKSSSALFSETTSFTVEIIEQNTTNSQQIAKVMHVFFQIDFYCQKTQ